jgi:hypothetical protein
LSVTYYAFQYPVTSFRIVAIHENRVDINIWIRGQMTGQLICRPDEVEAMADLFVDSSTPVCNVYFAGIEHGMAIVENIPDYEGYITDGRRVTTLRDLKLLVEASHKAHRELYEANLKQEMEM